MKLIEAKSAVYIEQRHKMALQAYQTSYSMVSSVA